MRFSAFEYRGPRLDPAAARSGHHGGTNPQLVWVAGVSLWCIVSTCRAC